MYSDIYFVFISFGPVALNSLSYRDKCQNTMLFFYFFPQLVVLNKYLGSGVTPDPTVLFFLFFFSLLCISVYHPAEIRSDRGDRLNNTTN